jgi:HK97 family phage prohead protease
MAMTKDSPTIQLRAQTNGSFQGYASVFAERDAYGDTMMRGCLATTLAEFKRKGRQPACLWAHDMSQPIGSYTTVEEDESGLIVAGRLATKGKAEEVRELIGMGAVSGLSIGFLPVREQYDSATKTNHIHELRLFESSLVSIPALDSARLTSVKSNEAITTTRQAEQTLREAMGLSRAEAEAFINHMRGLRDPGTGIDVAAVMATLQKSALRLPRTR